MSTVKVISGSTRPARFGDKPVTWIMELAAQHPTETFELIDLAELNLPFLDEPQPAITGVYSQEHTKAWAKIIGDADGFIFVTPEYNHGYSAALKNAIDYLAAEWAYKPVAFVSYGADAGGVRAVEHLRGVVSQLHMYDLKYQVAIPHYWTQVDQTGIFTASDAQIEAANTMIGSLIFWADHFKQARADLAKQSV